MKKFIVLAGLVAVAALLLVVVVPFASQAADHREAPLVDGAGEVDIADVYLCAPPCAASGTPDGTKTVMIMTVNSLALPNAATSYAFAENSQYWFFVDNNGDAQIDKGYCITFGPRGASAATPQTLRLYSVTTDNPNCSLGTLLATGSSTPANASVTPATRTITTIPGGGKIFAGPADDAFFFDLVGFNRVFCCGGSLPRSTPRNSFAGANVSAIVLEVPTASLVGTGNEGGLCPAASCIGVWARAKQGDVVDRMGRPAIATVLVPFNQRDSFNKTAPRDDNKKWKPTFKATLQSLGNCTPGLAGLLSPDLLTYDTASPGSGFPNGRRLTDDVIDVELGLITGCIGISSDGVSNDSTPVSSFPYVPLPNVAAP